MDSSDNGLRFLAENFPMVYSYCNSWGSHGFHQRKKRVLFDFSLGCLCCGEFLAPLCSDFIKKKFKI